MRAGLGLTQWQDRLAEQLETPFLECRVDARGPLHFTAPPHQVDIVFLETVHAVPAGLFCRLAGAVGRDRHDADAGTQAEGAFLPRELEVAHRIAQRLRRPQRFVERTALEQYR